MGKLHGQQDVLTKHTQKIFLNQIRSLCGRFGPHLVPNLLDLNLCPYLNINSNRSCQSSDEDVINVDCFLKNL